MVLMLLGCEQPQGHVLAPVTPAPVTPAPVTPAPVTPARKTVDIEELRPQVAEFCGGCHAIPSPESFPKKAWRREVDRGFGFYSKSGRHDLVVPPIDDVVGFYETLAPERLVVEPPKAESDDTGGAARFRRTSSDSPERVPPAVSFVDWLTLPNQDRRRHVICDMQSGMVGIATVTPQNISIESLTTLMNPSRVALCDLDGDGLDEMVIGELGSLSSEDHHRGAVVWLQWDRAQAAWRQKLLVSGLGRVADVRGADFDGDGDMDLVVAEFGHIRTGRVLVYENLGMQGDMPKLREHVVDQRHGAIDVPVADLNGDGRLDFVALISQEHEVIEAYLNSGDLNFERKTIFAAGDPAYGSSGIELLDFDADGDLDVLYTNGDTFGSDSLKPYHGISWLENQGGFPFLEHRVAPMVGVQRAAAADVDGDNDLDIVAVGFLPRNLVAAPELANHDSLIWLEQKQPGRFVRHSLESGKFVHAALAVGDFDEDGDNDLAVGNFQDLDGPHEPWLTIWWNTSKGGATHAEAPGEP
jgi:FG-GAP-like repeat